MSPHRARCSALAFAALLAFAWVALLPATGLAQEGAGESAEGVAATAATDSENEAPPETAVDPFDEALETEAEDFGVAVDDPYGDEDPVDEAAREKTHERGLEELVVTAAKRKQSVQDVPISVTALQGGFLEEQGATQFGELQKFVPNLQILPVTDARSTSIRIRGIGSVGSNAGIDPSVGVFIDGVYQGRAGMSVSDLLDIERVEVLRGPQGTLYGKNTAAGAINIVTKSPTDEVEAFGQMVFGNYNDVQFRGSLNTPIIPEKLALRLAGYTVTRDGYDLNRYNGEDVNTADKYGIRSKLRWMGSDSFDLVVTGDWSADNSVCCVGDILTYEGPTALGASFTDFANVTGIPLDTPDPYDRVVGANVKPYQKLHVGGVAIDVHTPVFSDHELRSLTSWRRYTSDSQFDGDFSVYDIVISNTDVKFDQLSTELLMVSPGGGTWEYQTGLYFFFSNLNTDDVLGYSDTFAGIANTRINALTALPDDPITPGTNTNENLHRTFNAAGFGQATYNLGEFWSFTGGFRVDYERKTRDGSSISSCTAPTPPVCGPDDYRNQERHVWNPQGTAIVRLRPTDAVMIYTSFANGFKSGGFNQIRTSDSVFGAIPSEFDDELSFNYEAGTKTTWFDNQLLSNLTAYFTDYRDFQAQFFDGSNIAVDNAGRMFSWGIESELRWVPDFIPDRGLVLGGSLGLNFTKYKEFEDSPATVPEQAQAVGDFFGFVQGQSIYAIGCGLLPQNDPNVATCATSLTGQRIDNAPRVSLNLFASYEYALPDMPLIWFAGGDYLFETFKYLDVDLDSNLIQKPINILGLRTGFKTDNDLMEFTLWVKNALDENWSVTGADVPIMQGYMLINAPPRTYGGTFTMRY